ncbi:hypothetical protein EDB89DRAFT_1844940 [Lactarius sanguifluus]|nr:hypothetical protein EDB89DRAFT_1844940 [Lactarius sanguifluus]
MEDPRFLKRELRGFSAQRENKRLDNYLSDEAHPFRTQDGWHEATVNIRLPVEGRRFSSEDDAPTLTIPNLFHRRITDIIRSVCASEKAQSFHFSPYTMHWAPDPDNPDKIERVYGETYSSDAMIQAQLDVDSLPRPEGDTTERVALGLMLASDSSQLTNFGSASVWPVYLMFANQSKQERVRPSCHAVHHLAYVPSVSPSANRRYLEETGQAPSADVTVHCKRELMHAIWNHLMDDAFVEGCTRGLRVRCTDDIERVFFFRLITYSADYPEKILLATIKYLGRSPCPRCLVRKKDIAFVGTTTDARTRNRLRNDNDSRRQKIERARKLIFNEGLAITSRRVQKLLGDHSLIPTRNAFSDKMSVEGQDYHHLFVVDLLHEVELGIWKSVLKHLIRILYASPGGNDLLAELDSRFHSVPTFGRDTIRKLPGNVSEMSKLAARDYEDILQVSSLTNASVKRDSPTFSAQYRFSKDCSQTTGTTGLSLISCFCSLHGMHMPSSAYTQSRRCRSKRLSEHHYVKHSGSSPISPVLAMLQKSSLERQLHAWHVSEIKQQGRAKNQPVQRSSRYDSI